MVLETEAKLRIALYFLKPTVKNKLRLIIINDYDWPAKK